jgi:hypothetical protein
VPPRGLTTLPMAFNTGLDEAVQPVLLGRLGHCPRGRPREHDLAYLHLVKHLGDQVGVGAEGAGLRGQLVQPVEGPVTLGRPGWPAGGRTQGSFSNRPGMQPWKRSSLARAKLSGIHRGCTPLEKPSSRSPIAYTFRWTSTRTSLQPSLR